MSLQPAPDGTTADPAATLASRLADPGVANALNTLLDHVDLLALLVESLDQFISRSEVIGDSLAAGLAELRQGSEHSGVDVAGIAAAGSQLAGVIPQAAPQLVSAVESGAMEKALATLEVSAEALPQVERLATSLMRGAEQFERAPVEISGPISMMRQLRDPDINRALSYLLTIAKTLGADLKQPPATPATAIPPTHPSGSTPAQP